MENLEKLGNLILVTEKSGKLWFSPLVCWHDRDSHKQSLPEYGSVLTCARWTDNIATIFTIYFWWFIKYEWLYQKYLEKSAEVS